VFSRENVTGMVVRFLKCDIHSSHIYSCVITVISNIPLPENPKATYFGLNLKGLLYSRRQNFGFVLDFVLV